MKNLMRLSGWPCGHMTISHILSNRTAYCKPTPSSDLFKMRIQTVTVNVTPLLLSLAGSQLKQDTKAHTVFFFYYEVVLVFTVCCLSSTALLCKICLNFHSNLYGWPWNRKLTASSFLAKIPSEFALAWCNYCGWKLRKRTKGSSFWKHMCLSLEFSSPWGQNIMTRI